MLKKFNEALSDCHKAIELDPAFIKAYVRAAKCQVQQGKEEKKKEPLKKRKKRHLYCTLLGQLCIYWVDTGDTIMRV